MTIAFIYQLLFHLFSFCSIARGNATLHEYKFNLIEYTIKKSPEAFPARYKASTNNNLIPIRSHRCIKRLLFVDARRVYIIRSGRGLVTHVLVFRAILGHIKRAATKKNV